MEAQLVEEDIRERVVLKLGKGLFAVDVKVVREFLEPTDFVEVPQAPHHVLGLINIRGEDIAVVDLGTKLGLPPCEVTEDSRISILEVPNHNGGVSVIGALTDDVVDVTVLDESTTAEMPNFGCAWNMDAIKQVARYNDQTVIILEAEKLFGASDISL